MSNDQAKFIKSLALAYDALSRIRQDSLDLEDHLYTMECAYNNLIGVENEPSSEWLSEVLSAMYSEEDAMSPYCDCEYCRADRASSPDYRMD